MATQQSDSLFTNTRLMVAGAVLGVIGAVLALVWVKNEVREKAGGDMVTTYFVSKPVARGAPLGRGDVRSIQVPASYVKEVTKLVTPDTLELTIGRKATRDLDAGEPLVLTEFQTRPDLTGILEPTKGGRYRRIIVDRKSLPENLGPGAIINVLGSFNFAKDRGADDEVPAMRVLDRVQVIATGKEGGVTVDLGEFASELLTALDNYKTKSYTIEVLGRDTIKSGIKEQVPVDTVDLVRQKFKDLGVQMPLQD